MRRATSLTLAAAATTAATVAFTVIPAQAALGLTPSLTQGASAYSAAAATGSASLKANLQLTGTLGGIIDALIKPIVDNDLDPLVTALQGNVNSIVGSALGAGSSLTAGTTASEQQNGTAPGSFPSDTVPSPCTATGVQPCYSGPAKDLNQAPLLTMHVGATWGYVEQVQQSTDSTNPVLGRASAAGVSVSPLPSLTQPIPNLPNVTDPLISVTNVDSKSNCPNDGAVGATKPATAPSVSVSVGYVTMLGGLVTFGVADGQIASLTVNGTSYADIFSLPTTTVSGVTVEPYGNSVLVSIPLSVSQVLNSLGLSSSVVTALSGFGPVSTVALSLVVGPNSAVTSTNASASGIGIGADLSGSLSFDLLSLATATVNIPSGITSSNNGNLLDLRLAYTNCQSGENAPATVPAIPPALV